MLENASADFGLVAGMLRPSRKTGRDSWAYRLTGRSLPRGPEALPNDPPCQLGTATCRIPHFTDRLSLLAYVPGTVLPRRSVRTSVVDAGTRRLPDRRLTVQALRSEER